MASDIRDFSVEPSSPSSPNHVTFSDDVATIHQQHNDVHSTTPDHAIPPKRTNTFNGSRSSPDNLDEKTNKGPDPILKRRGTRSSTTRTLNTINDYPARPNWQPGQEPGLDPSKRNGGRGDLAQIHAYSEITVVDYSQDDMQMWHLDNKTLPEWIEKHGKKEDWVKCRWINVNGLSWDVIAELGKHKKLHKLALEDVTNTKNRTKADWYSDHTYIVLTLQKLVHLHPETEFEDGDDDTYTLGSKKSKSFVKKIRDFFTPENIIENRVATEVAQEEARDPEMEYVAAHTEGAAYAPVQKLRTLQRYHGGPNQERMAYMEQKSPLTTKNLAVCAEQVSIFLTADNEVISFFEASAEDVENPILDRLRLADTILRRSCDASMLTQAIIDAIIDLAIPVATAYQDVIGDLELDVLTEPAIKHTTRLYIVTSEITTMRNFISPITSLVAALKDHKGGDQISTSVLPEKSISREADIRISRLTQTYLGDVEDHCVLITQSLDQLHHAAGGMIDLIFNTISAYQNESMKQLTTVTIIFLPLTVITGYFGMNFHEFPSIDNDESYFWKIAAPVAVGTLIIMLRETLFRWFYKTSQRRGINRHRKLRLGREEAKKKL